MARGRTTSRALYTLLNTFDATITVHTRPLEWDAFTSDRALVSARYAWECKWMDEESEERTPWPTEGPTTAATFCIVHDAMSGHAAKMLKVQLQALDQWRDDYGQIDAGVLPRKSVLEALELMGTRFVLLLGAGPVSMWRSDLTIERTRGRSHLWKDRYTVMALESPAAVMRAGMNGTPFEGRWREDLRVFVERMIAGQDATEVLARGCVLCEAGADGWDFDCVAACRKHAEVVAKGREKTRKKWHDPGEGQTEMEGL